ncbi:hypothetical protein [Tsukamurella pulmonis]|uniref:hypothetical protein n=1 Tax=Tsukamurella pulmonis TaxID=47312 RepID=UPI001111CE98|nr:hypothetical protein [Tsukamurella pulmonis]
MPNALPMMSVSPLMMLSPVTTNNQVTSSGGLGTASAENAQHANQVERVPTSCHNTYSHPMDSEVERQLIGQRMRNDALEKKIKDQERRLREVERWIKANSPRNGR